MAPPGASSGEDELVAVLLALLSSVLLGGADFAGGLAAKRMRAVVVVVWSNAAGLALAVLVLTFFLPGQASPPDLVWGLLAGLCGSAGAALLYRALASGAMMLAAPVAAVSAAVLPVVIGVAAGERLSPLAFVGVGVAAIALALVSRRPGKRPVGRPSDPLRTVVLAVGAGLSFGAFMVLLSHTATSSGLWPLVAARSAALGVLVVVTGLQRVSLRAPVRQLRFCWLAGLLDMASSVCYLLAVRDGSLAVVGVLASLSPVSTVVLARLLLKERTYLWQRVGAGLATGSVLLLAIA